jgi:hypothetical protein
MSNVIQLLGNKLSRTLSALRMAGKQYDGDRDVYQALGYEPTNSLTYESYRSRYKRQDIAKAVIDRPVDATWRGGVSLIEPQKNKKNAEKTEFEKAWDDLYKRLKLHSVFARLDRLTGIGKYGVLLLGINNGDFTEPITTSELDLLYVKPLGEGSAVIKTWEEDPKNERYNRPKTYDVTIINPGSSTSSQKTVHYSRVIHVTSGLLESDTEGTPRLMAVYNRLFDLEKLVGGSAEMFWRGARPGYQVVADPDFQEIDTTGLQDQLDEYEHKIRRFLTLQGLTVKALETQISDPKNHVLVQYQAISAVTGIPLRKLLGSEQAKLASTEDNNSWNELIKSRREEYAEPTIINPFADFCIAHQILPEPKNGYAVKWDDLWAPSEKERVENGKNRAESFAKLTPSIENGTLSVEAVAKYFLGLEVEEAEQIAEILGQNIDEERNDFEEEE